MSIIFTYEDDFPISTRTYYTKDINDKDLNLTQTFAEFVDFTRAIGYSDGSWTNIIEELHDCVTNGYSIYDWASDVQVNTVCG